MLCDPLGVVIARRDRRLGRRKGVARARGEVRGVVRPLWRAVLGLGETGFARCSEGSAALEKARRARCADVDRTVSYSTWPLPSTVGLTAGVAGSCTVVMVVVVVVMAVVVVVVVM